MCWRGAVRLQSGTHQRLESCYYTKMSLEGSHRGQLAWSLTPTWQWDPGSHMPECMHVGRGGFCSRDVLRLPLHMCCVSVKSDPITHLSSTVCFHTTLKTHSVWPRDIYLTCVFLTFLWYRDFVHHRCHLPFSCFPGSQFGPWLQHSLKLALEPVHLWVPSEHRTYLFISVSLELGRAPCL